jgi:hypothetical protein
MWKPLNQQKFLTDRVNGYTREELAVRHGGTMRQVKYYIEQMNKTTETKATVKNSTPKTNDEVTQSGEERVLTKDSLTISLNKTPIHTLEQLLEYAQVDTSIWEVEKFIVNKWEGFIKTINPQGDFDTKVQPLFQVKAFLKKRKEVVNLKAMYTELKEELKQFSPIIRNIPRTPTYNTGKLLQICISDHHLGKLCWGEEVGSDYDLKIAKKTYFEAVEDLIEKAKRFNIEKILFIIGNDFLNSDNLLNTTTKGTPQDTDSRHFKLYKESRVLLCDVINRLRLIAPVDVVVVPGNHDHQTMFYLGDALELFYAKDPEVNIFNSPKKRKYYDYGKVLLMLTHGNEEKVSQLPMIMAQEEPHLWAKTKFREVHIGHFHCKKVYSRIDVDENLGVRTRILPSLTTADYWHYSKGYVGNIRSSEAFVWDKEKGMEAQLIHNIV